MPTILVTNDDGVFPLPPVRGVRVTRLGKRVYTEGVIERKDPRGRSYFWIGGEAPLWKKEEGTDFTAVDGGYISITPLRLDLTDRASLERLRSMQEALENAAGEKE
jgi:5'-nucleotidase